jgi:ankyrin repeat protein
MNRLFALIACILTFFSFCAHGVGASEQPRQPQEENLLRSIALGQIDTAYRLLAQGHNPNVAEHPSGWTPLIHAANSGDFHLARALLSAGADINLGCADGWTPIMFASVRGHLDLMRLLLDNRANIHLVAATGATALGSAKLGEHPEAIRLIEEALSAARLHEVIFEKEKGVEAVILSASYAGDGPLVERLLREGHSANTVSSGGWTPLMLAAAGGRLPTMHVLVGLGAEVNTQDADGWSPLMFCTHANNLPCMALLLEAQADIFLANKDNVTVLQLAGAEGHVEAFNLIVSMTYCHELLSGHHSHVAEMVRDGVDPAAIDCSEVEKAMQQHASASAATAAAVSASVSEGEGAGAGSSESGLTEPVTDF